MQAPPSIYSLAQQYLQHRKIKLAHILTLEKVNQAIAASGAGLDHTIGEQVIALGDDSYRDEFDMFFMLTDRRLAGRVLFHNRRRFFNLELNDLARLQFDFLNPAPCFQYLSSPESLAKLSAALGKPTPEIALLLEDLMNLFHLPDALIVEPMKKPLINFLAALNQIPPEQLLPPSQLLVQPTPEDPTGAQWALSLTRHASCVQALQMALSAYRRGWLTAELAGDFTSRVMLLNKTLLYGRGRMNGWWLSPLSLNDLVFAFCRLFGNPAYYQQQGDIHLYDFDIKKGGAGKALAASAVGLAAAAILGVGWVSLPGKAIHNLRVKLMEASSLCGFSIAGLCENNYLPLYAARYDLFDNLARMLIEQETQLTLLRCAFGWTEPPHLLATKPPTMVEARFGELQ
ncbi:MAG: hypothetical protein AB1757_17225 [Acidobacteriota bacterium]